MTAIVIGVGNRDRGDDAAGPLVCDRLRARPGASASPRMFVCEGSILDLALHWDRDDHVVIVDAMQPGDEPGRVVTIDATLEPLAVPGAVSTHEIDVAAAIPPQGHAQPGAVELRHETIHDIGRGRTIVQ